ncbi:hypothetical protein [Actinoplanes sp. NBRC 103695]|uniref:hypothetical protein n=1 Tax=Actinoplanes sp. NBRC 103695 TaxID=3032202 RepID=UPI0024A0AD30|nr:hypothetical protein [Actinoplanes sp. NBRC 103695]GLY95579.1 hypothetical protein Acsp02_28340 [Actinoplanes sp. NBRC 103695]
MRSHRPLTAGILIALVVVALQALLVPLFAGPAASIAPRDLPLALAGPPPATAALAAKLRAEHPGAFEITQVADVSAADRAIRDREVYGAIVLLPPSSGAAGPASGPASGDAAPAGGAPAPADGTAQAGGAAAPGGMNAEVHVASAAGPAVSALLGQAAGPSAKVVDVVPLHPGDPRGTGFGAGFLPLAITALLAGVLIFFVVRGRGARLAALLTFAVAGGLGGAAVLRGWLDVLPGDYWAVAGVLGLFGLAVAGAMTGLGAVLDRPGLGLGAVMMFLVGNALGAVAAVPELLPQPWGAVGQALPIGAGATLLRSVAYFDGNGGLTAAAVLGSYAIGGLLLTALGRRRTASTTTEAASTTAAEPEHALVR